MIAVCFDTPEKKLHYALLYKAFLGSKYQPESLAAIDNGLMILHKLKAVGESKDIIAKSEEGVEHVADTLQCISDSESPALELTDEEAAYIIKAISPPHLAWTMQGIETFDRIRQLLTNGTAAKS